MLEPVSKMNFSDLPGFLELLDDTLMKFKLSLTTKNFIFLTPSVGLLTPPVRCLPLGTDVSLN